MIPPSSAMQELARRVLDPEMPARPDVEDVTSAADAVFRKLWSHLTPLVGSTGFHILLGRAVHLARPEFPLLEGVSTGAESDGRLAGLSERARGQHAGEVRDAVTAVLAGFLGLMAYFIGDELAARIVSRAWPDLPPGTAGSAFEEEGV